MNEKHLMRFRQPRSQGLSSLPPLVVGIKTLVAAGHVTTQNLGGKKSVGREGWQSVLIIVVVNFVGFKTSSSRLKLPALSGFDVEFCR